jgi:hypothetical protein
MIAFAPSDLRILFRDPALLPDRAALDGDCRACGRATFGESEFCPRCHALAARALDDDQEAIQELRHLVMQAAS